MHEVKRILRIGGIVLIILVLIGAGALFLRTPRPSTGLVQPSSSPSAVTGSEAPTAVVTRGSIEQTVSASGNVAALRQATLTFRSNGPVTAVLVEEGQQVKAGQVLARLDTVSLEQQIVSAQASLNTAQARLQQAQKPPTEEELASAQAALDSAKANFEKVKAGPTNEELASAQAALASARASYEKVKAGPTKDDLAAAKATLDSAMAALKQAQAAYDRVKARPDVQLLSESLNLQNATIDLQRAQADYDKVAKGSTASDLASAAAQVASARSTLAQLMAQPTASDLASAAAQVASAEATLAQLQNQPDARDVAVYQAQVDESAAALAQAQAKLDDAVIIAPFDGTVLTIQVNEGEWASTGAPAIVLADTSGYILDLNVDEADVAEVADGQTVYLSFDALQGATITGTVAFVAPSSTNEGGAVAYAARIRFAPGQLPLRLGMTASVKIVVARADDALLVPNRAITADREARRYYVTRLGPGGLAQLLEVRIGLRDGSQTQILEGLQEGDQVVLPVVPAQGQTQGSFGGGGAGPFGGMGQGGGQ
jgi:HlyD family secretion protein